MSPTNSCRFFILAALFILCTTFVVYLPALQNESVGSWDDSLYVFENSNIKSIDLIFLKWSFTTVVISLWHPLTLFSLALDYTVWGVNPLGYHLTNILIHTLNTFLVLILVIQLIRLRNSSKVELTPKALIAGTVTAFLFGIHPLHVESVAWISERKDVLCAFFFLLTILAYLKYTSAADSKKPAFYIASLISFLFALLSKPMAVSLPIVLLILDFYPLNRLKKGIKTPLIEKLPFFALSALIAVVTIWASQAGGALKSLETYPLMPRLFIAACSYIFYLLKMVFPFNLALFYPYPVKLNLFAFEYAGSLVLLLGITFLCASLSRRNKLFLAVWLYYLFTLIPVIGIFQVGDQAMANRYTYLPSIGPFLLAGLYAGTVFERHVKKHSQIIIIAILAIISGGLMNMTSRQIAIWKDPIHLWTYEIKLFPHVALAHNNLGLAYHSIGELERAISEFKEAIKLDRYEPRAYYNLGNAHFKMGLFEEAIEEYKTCIMLNPGYTDAHYNLGSLYAKMGRFEKAIEEYKIVIKLKPDHPNIHNDLGNAYLKNGQLEEAIQWFQTALRLRPTYLTYYELGTAYAKHGRYEEAIPNFQRALTLKPDSVEAHYNLGVAYFNKGLLDKAKREFKITLTLQSDFLPAWQAIESLNKRGNL